MSQWISELNTWVYGIVTGLLAGILYLVRKIHTNEKQIELLKQEIATREEYRKDNDTQIKEQLKELRDDIKSILNK